MESATFPPEVGGSGLTVTDDANPTTGLANGGHRARLVPALSQVVAVARNTVTKATEAAASAEAAANAADSAAESAETAQAAVLNGAAIVPTWTTGTSWGLGQLVISGSNSKTYRKITATSVTTIDPANDATNWQPLPVDSGTKATTEQATAGVDDASYMTPLKTRQAIENYNFSLAFQQATALCF